MENHGKDSSVKEKREEKTLCKNNKIRKNFEGFFKRRGGKNKSKVLTWQEKGGKIGIHINIYDAFWHCQ